MSAAVKLPGKWTGRLEQEAFLRGYLECALWSSTGPNDEPLDDDYGPDDLSESALAECRQDCAALLAGNIADLHDFWLTRNGHGAGFWDRGLGERGERLTAACRPYGSVYLYPHEGQIHI